MSIRRVVPDIGSERLEESREFWLGTWTRSTPRRCGAGPKSSTR
jgi:hypothetical protein